MPETPLRIRDACRADLDALVRVRPPREAHEDTLNEVQAGAVRFLVALLGEDVVGFASLYLEQPTSRAPKSQVPKLSDCHVAPAHRRAGIGKSLVAAREEIARQHGCERLYVSVHPDENPDWLEFFQRRGYQPLQAHPYEHLELRHGPDGPTAVRAQRIDLETRL